MAETGAEAQAVEDQGAQADSGRQADGARRSPGLGLTSRPHQPKRSLSAHPQPSGGSKVAFSRERSAARRGAARRGAARRGAARGVSRG
ncbi:hypothetical protein PSCLAVI8L_490009 [Pseudoclavibacter sp. 8L]|nr:hypothetical protein PSCLAVI8L_490009 [Pseudoclavibacter sp. 8L]